MPFLKFEGVDGGAIWILTDLVSAVAAPETKNRYPYQPGQQTAFVYTVGGKAFEVKGEPAEIVKFVNKTVE